LAINEKGIFAFGGEEDATVANFGKRRLDEVAELAERLTMWADALKDAPDIILSDIRAAAAELLALRGVVLAYAAKEERRKR
jgi:hypothetical protein